MEARLSMPKYTASLILVLGISQHLKYLCNQSAYFQMIFLLRQLLQLSPHTTFLNSKTNLRAKRICSMCMYIKCNGESLHLVGF